MSDAYSRVKAESWCPLKEAACSSAEQLPGQNVSSELSLLLTFQDKLEIQIFM